MPVDSKGMLEEKVRLQLRFLLRNSRLKFLVVDRMMRTPSRMFIKIFIYKTRYD